MNICGHGRLFTPKTIKPNKIVDVLKRNDFT